MQTRPNNIILLSGRNSGMASDGRGYNQGRVHLLMIIDYSGNLTTTLCPMMQVMFSHLNIGQTFPDCAIITLRAAEEATYWGILFNTDKNDNNNMKMYCRGPESFLVYNTNSDTNGWTITRC